MFVMVDFVRKMTVKESCKCDKYGLFEHLLFLFSHHFQFQKVCLDSGCEGMI